MEKYNTELVKLVSTHYEISRTEAEQRIDMFIHFTTGTETLTELLQSYGKTDKEIKKLLSLQT